MKLAMKEYNEKIEIEKEEELKKEFEEKKTIFLAEKETTRKVTKLSAVTYTSRGTRVDRTVNYNLYSENEITPVNNEENDEKPTKYKDVIDVKATAYCLCSKCCGKSPDNPNYGVTSSGLKIIPGTNMKVIAVDKNIIPLGTKVYVEGLDGTPDYGYAIAADTGSAIKNYKIDLYMDSHSSAYKWGCKNMRVYILD